MPKLVLGNKNYSSWSFRGWLALRWAGVAFDEEVIPLHQADSADHKQRLSPSGLVPALHLDDGTATGGAGGGERAGGTVLWDSLAIAEWAHEQTGTLWPADPTARAVARSVACEMHSGFMALRQAMPMNLGRRTLGFVPTSDAQRDIERVLARWEGVRAAYGRAGSFLFGGRCFADAMFVPVATRLQTYGVELHGVAADYAATLLADADVAEWIAAARSEPWSIPVYDS